MLPPLPPLDTDSDSASNCLACPRPLTWRDRFRERFFPAAYCELPEAPATHRDVLVVRVFTHLSWLDRLRVLLTGRIRVESKTVTEHVIGDHRTCSVFMALPPRWCDREA